MSKALGRLYVNISHATWNVWGACVCGAVPVVPECATERAPSQPKVKRPHQLHANSQVSLGSAANCRGCNTREGFTVWQGRSATVDPMPWCPGHRVESGATGEGRSVHGAWGGGGLEGTTCEKPETQPLGMPPPIISTTCSGHKPVHRDGR